MTDLPQAVETVAQALVAEHGFSDSGTAAPLARELAASVFPLRLVAEWLRRAPEAVSRLAALLETASGGGATRRGGVSALWTVAPDGEPTAPAQSSEPAGRASFATEVPGVRGARAESVVIDTPARAAQALGADAFRTRPVDPSDVLGLGTTAAFRGHQPVLDAAGETLRAHAKFPDGKVRACHFLDKRGPVIMYRIAEGPQAGSIVNGPAAYIDPARRAEVLAALDALPLATEGFNFDPFEGAPDPWTEPVDGDPRPL